MTTRRYDLNTGIETSDVPTVSDPSADSDIMSKGYADTTYAVRANWGHSVADATALKAIGTTGANMRVDQQVRLKDDNSSIWKFDSGSSATGDDVTVIQPTTGTGRWLLVTSSSSSTGSSGSGINYITNTNFDSGATGITGYAAYADAAAATPVDGTGGSPTVTITRTTSSPLRSTASGLITKDAANRQGEGVSYDFTIDTADQAKIMAVSFDYAVGSGTFAGGTDSTTGDLNVYIYDVTNAQIIQPAGFKVLGSVSGQFYKHIATFQTASNSTSYRLIWNVASTSASAWTLKIDNVSVGPQIMQYGAPADDMMAYTPTFTGFGTVSNVSVFSSRVADNLFVRGYFTAGTPTGVAAKMKLGYKGANGNVTLDTTKLNTNNKNEIIGSIARSSTLAGTLTILAIAASPTDIAFGLQDGSSGGLTAANGNAIIGAGAEISFSFVVPIAGWSSTVLMSNDTDTRVVAASVTHTTNLSVTAGSNIVLPSASYDTHGAYNASTGVYTVPVSGFYTVSLTGFKIAASTAAGLFLNKNSVAVARIVVNPGTNLTHGGSSRVQCVAGDTLSIVSDNSTTYVFDAFSGASTGGKAILNIERLSGPSAIAASESVNAHYTGAPPTGTLSASYNKITYGTKVFDSHNTYSSGTYTIPVSGKYSIDANAAMIATMTTNSDSKIAVEVNGVTKLQGTVRALNTSGSVTLFPSVSGLLSCVAGDLITIRSYTDGTSTSFGSSAFDSYFSISRVGN